MKLGFMKLGWEPETKHKGKTQQNIYQKNPNPDTEMRPPLLSPSICEQDYCRARILGK